MLALKPASPHRELQLTGSTDAPSCPQEALQRGGGAVAVARDRMSGLSEPQRAVELCHHVSKEVALLSGQGCLRIRWVRVRSWVGQACRAAPGHGINVQLASTTLARFRDVALLPRALGTAWQRSERRHAHTVLMQANLLTARHSSEGCSM